MAVGMEELGKVSEQRISLRAVKPTKTEESRTVDLTQRLNDTMNRTYVAAQLGHAKPTTTLAHYAHWIPRGDKGWVDRLAGGSAKWKPDEGHGC